MTIDLEDKMDLAEMSILVKSILKYGAECSLTLYCDENYVSPYPPSISRLEYTAKPSKFERFSKRVPIGSEMRVFYGDSKIMVKGITYKFGIPFNYYLLDDAKNFVYEGRDRFFAARTGARKKEEKLKKIGNLRKIKEIKN